MMGAHISKRQIAQIIQIINQWNPDNKFTWDALIDAMKVELGIDVTRQTLNNSKDIKVAYLSKKQQLRSSVKHVIKIPPSLNIAAHRIKKLEEENKRLKSERDELLARFVTWQLNAESKNVTLEMLNNGLPRFNRRVEKKLKKT